MPPKGARDLAFRELQVSQRGPAERHPVAAAGMTALNDINIAFKKRWLLFGSWIVLSFLLFAHPLTALIRMCISNDDASYILLIPFISVWILFVERHKIFLNLSWDAALGGGLLFGAADQPDLLV